MGKNLYELAIDHIAEKYKTELMAEEIDDVNSQIEEEKIDEIPVNFYSLSEIPFDKIQDFNVSKLNTFKDIIWDWRQEGSQIYKDDCFFSWDKEVSEGVSLLANENKYLCRLLKMIAFYSLPQNACLQNVKSFNTSKAILKHLQSLGKFLYKHKLFVDIQGNGSFTNTIYLTKEHFTEFIKNDLKDSGAIYDFAKQIKHWVGLSKSKLIPMDYRLNFEPFDADMYSKLAKNAEDNKGEYLPISIDTLSELVPFCIDNIEKNSAEILKFYSVLWPVIAGGDIAKTQPFEWGKAIYELLSMDLKVIDLQMYKFKDYSQVKMSKDLNTKLRYAVKNHPEWNKNNPFYLSNIWKIKQSEILNIALELGIELESIDLAIVYDVSKIKMKVMELVTELRNSCVVILFLVTGMRNSEMYLLEAGNCWQLKGSEDDFRISITVPKTSEGSTGDPVVLPVPEIAYKAFKCLEALTDKARVWGGSKKLMVSSTSNFGKEIVARSINQFLKRWFEDLGIEHIHPHQFRKTIAMFAIYQNPNNISVIRRLFSHQSLAMTLSYIVKMPGMAEEIKLAVIERNKELLSELLEAIDKKCIGGKAGSRIKRLVDESTIFKAKLNDDGWEGLEQYIQILLQDGLSILHRTSFGAICTNTHSGLVHLAPESCNCNVTDCNWSVFTANSIEDLENTIKFHDNFLKDDFCSEKQKRFSHKTIRDCVERLYELKGIDYVKSCFPKLIKENFLTLEAGGRNYGKQDTKA
ncbi:Phage integrase family protein [Lentibacillus halodurans]|uniref:Phage integrase family protein n=1 Tax=Lentibacillus halodurans TaxID=237679 RepID=A0A1I0Z4Z2_9BACI|nr:site-specific integrase [Lentibacillus halodurans]SFB20407.1 Phage integrase family protein [Lentibacillus halodurans]